MSFLDPDIVISDLTKMSLPKLKEISTQDELQIDDNYTIFSFKLNLYDTKGVISAKYNSNTNSYDFIYLNLHFSKAISMNDYIALEGIATSFKSIIKK